MKVALISSIFPPAIGGPAKHTYDQAKALKEKGVKTFVVTFGEKNFDRTIDNVRVYYLRKYNYKIRLLSLLFKYCNAYIRLNRIFKKETPHIVHHISGGGYLSLISGIVSKKKKIPSIVKFAGDLTWERSVSNLKNLPRYEDIFSFNMKAKFLKRFEQYVLNNFDYIIATSGFQMKTLIDIYQFSVKKLVRLPNFIDLTEYEKKTPKNKSDRKIQILNVCRFARWKRIDLCIQMFSKLNNENLELKIVGSGNTLLEKELKDLCKDLNVAERVVFVGEVNPVEISRHFIEADIFLSTTVYEPFGIVFVEAMAAGLPIVATKVGGIPEIVPDGKAGFLIDPNDIDDMAEKLQILIKNPVLRQKFGQFGIKKAQEFDLKRNIDNFIIKLYENLAKKNLLKKNE
jgi:glycosyltransferase involved in cell wall biosynthesis